MFPGLADVKVVYFETKTSTVISYVYLSSSNRECWLTKIILRLLIYIIIDRDCLLTTISLTLFTLSLFHKTNCAEKKQSFDMNSSS